MKRLIASIFSILYSVSLFCGMGNMVQAEDLLETAFQESIANEHLIMLGNGKNAVGNDVFREGSEINTSSWVVNKTCFINGVDMNVGRSKSEKIDNEDDCTTMGGEYKNIDVQKRPPLIVRITKFLLRITVAISITMVLYNGVKWIWESIEGSETSENSRKSLTYVVGGLLLALSSVAIVNLISSVSISSLKNADEYIKTDHRAQFEMFCEWAKENTTNRNMASGRAGRSQQKLEFFCNNPAQPVNWSDTQASSFVIWAVSYNKSQLKNDAQYFAPYIDSFCNYTYNQVNLASSILVLSPAMTNPDWTRLCTTPAAVSKQRQKVTWTNFTINRVLKDFIEWLELQLGFTIDLSLETTENTGGGGGGGDYVPTDSDNDGIPDTNDNCPNNYNPSQNANACENNNEQREYGGDISDIVKTNQEILIDQDIIKITMKNQGDSTVSLAGKHTYVLCDNIFQAPVFVTTPTPHPNPTPGFSRTYILEQASDLSTTPLNNNRNCTILYL